VGSSFLLLVIPANMTASAVHKAAVEAHARGKTVTVTGCLRKADDEDAFIVVTEEANNYELISSHLPLKDYVDHKVAVTGKMQGQQPQDGEASEIGEKPTILFQVTKLKVISQKCEH
jgi:hypothetical protein